MPSNERLDALSQETWLLIWLTPASGRTVPVDSVCERLLTEFPGAVITAQNTFAAKRLALEDYRKYAQERLRQGTLEPWSYKTMEELNSGVDRLIADNRRAELSSGPKKSMAIPLGNGTQLKGTVGAKAIKCQGQWRRSDGTVANLVRFLESLNIGQVEILERDSKPFYLERGSKPSCSEDLGQK